MPQRLTERFQVDDKVEITFQHSRRWQPAVVIRHAPPGVWVRTADGREWFVTNGRRIRKRGEPDNA